MGILNLTPDSFFEGSRVKISKEQVLTKASQMVNEGADILDLGGYSTRPGAVDISVSEEIDRVVPPIEWIKEAYPEMLISLDTFRSQVAKKGIEAGADLINDVSAGNIDPEILPVVAESGLPYIAMHMRGTPQTMKGLSDYSDLIPEILYYFAEKVDLFKKLGIKDVILDPGFGFAKTAEQGFHLLKNWTLFRSLGLPVLAGISRKSMIYKTLDVTASEALNGTTALHMVALQQGVNILRVHDVKEAKETIKLYEKLYP
ncbi:dihydropteroate synthase [Algoriphagus sp. oki45]|uniref:dihydropteroate synthase n=1 Tax=Algoriphagus sp. oki45 TaxID=3067294 RepID=UPI0030C7772E